MRPLQAVALAAVVAGGCGSQPGLGTPRPESVEPNRGYAITDVPVTIHGESFLARTAQPSGGGAPVVSTAHRAWLDDVELPGVAWIDDRTLRATVPAGLPLGPHRLTVEDALGGRGVVDGAYTVLAAPALSAVATVDPPRVAVGQPFTVTLTVVNGGGADLVALQLPTPALTSQDGAGAQLVAAPAAVPAVLASGGTVSAAWQFASTAQGVLQVATSAQATDDLTGQALAAVPPSAPAVTVQRPAALGVAPDGLVLPATLPVGGEFEVTMTVVNAGDVEARDVTPAALSIMPGSTAAATYRSGPRPASATLTGGGSARFSWTFAAGPAAGTLQLSGWAAGVDAALGSPVTALPAASNRAAVVAPRHTLTVSVMSAAGSVSSSPAGIACAAGQVCSAAFDAGLGITLSATSTAVRWAGCDSSLANLCVVNALSADRSVSAAF